MNNAVITIYNGWSEWEGIPANPKVYFIDNNGKMKRVQPLPLFPDIGHSGST